MNERIKALIEQSQPAHETFSKEGHDKWMEKFAELIIKECNNIVLTTSVEGGAELLRGAIATKIQNTLGVEK